MEWDFLYVLQMSKPQTFQELAIKAHNMEVTIANCHDNSFVFTVSRNEKPELKRNVKFFNNPTKEVLFVSKAELVWIIGRPKLE